MADGWRQPGSAFKPINYITGIQDGTLTAASLFMDVTTDFGGGWTPTDADRLERGPLRLREALQVSLNIPSIKAAAYNGVDHVLETARKFGIRFQPGVDPGLSVGIGTTEIHMIDLVSAYGAIANGGVLMPRTTIVKVTDPQGNVIWPDPKTKPKASKVVSPQAAYVIANILASNTDPAQNPFWSARKLTNAVGTRRPAALKTGTTDSTIDLTAAGFVAPPTDPSKPAIATVAWMGNSDNSAPPEGVVSLESAASLWQDFMNEETRSHADRGLRRAERASCTRGSTRTRACGRAPGRSRPSNEIFVDGTQPTKSSDMLGRWTSTSATGDLWQDGCTGPKVTKVVPRPVERRVQLPAVGAVQRRMDQACDEGVRCPWRAGEHGHLVLLRSRWLGAVRRDLGRAAAADEEVRGGADAHAGPVLDGLPVPERLGAAVQLPDLAVVARWLPRGPRAR